MQNLTDRQSEILTFIANYRQDHGYSPSWEEIASGINIHLSTLREHLFAMKKKSVIKWVDRVPRSITIEKQPETDDLPTI